MVTNRFKMVVIETVVSTGTINEIIANNITEIMTAAMVAAVTIEIMTAETMATGITKMAVEVAEKALEVFVTTIRIITVIITNIEMAEEEAATRGRLQITTNQITKDQIITGIISIVEVVDDKNPQLPLHY